MKPATLSPQQHTELLEKLGPAWSIHDHILAREFEFPKFPDVIAFVNRIAEMAEAANHHPDLHIRYRRLLVELSTHEIGGLSERDAALARQISAAYDQSKKS